MGRLIMFVSSDNLIGKIIRNNAIYGVTQKASVNEKANDLNALSN